MAVGVARRQGRRDVRTRAALRRWVTRIASRRLCPRFAKVQFMQAEMQLQATMQYRQAVYVWSMDNWHLAADAAV